MTPIRVEATTGLEPVYAVLQAACIYVTHGGVVSTGKHSDRFAPPGIALIGVF